MAPMPLITLQDAELAFGLHPLLDRAALAVDEREHVGLIGRNGTGKSSLLQVIHGVVPLDGGELARRDGLRTVLVEQEPLLPAASTLRESLALRGRLPALAGEAHDERERWRTEARLVEFLHRFGLDEAMRPALASGGERKRAALALAFALAPDLVLLDEPTNHLDLDGIALLEKLVRQQPAAIVITHDRMFLDRVTTRIVELDRGLIRSYPGNFAAYEARKTEELSAEAIANRKFDAFWKQEEAWIRKGVEARRTRDMGRVRRLELLRSERAARRERQRGMTLALRTAERSGKLVAELEGVGKRFGEKSVVRGLDLRIMRGDRLGVIGPNGAGKSTLLKLVLGTMAPDTGTVRRGTKLQVAYFDQMREQLDDERTLAETISPGGEWIETPGGRKHVLSYLGDFLFPPQRAQAPVSTLSGGERNRLLLARLFAQPANLLVLDEPTNDLDIESLEILEETLQAYPGTLLLVSHDRTFLDNVVTQTLASEGDGRWREYVGGYSDWVAQRPPPAAAAAPAAARPATPRTAQRPAKLSFKEQRELEGLPAALDALEREQIALGERMCAADYRRQGADVMRADRARAAEIEKLLAQMLEQWVELEGRAPSKIPLGEK
ncbi:MAG: ATP-binding cassette domain-containing protein [Burkholderiales bacterium]|nr:ATP-binding cassette domain-containing protein [Burkholderiales bacterium]